MSVACWVPPVVSGLLGALGGGLAGTLASRWFHPAPPPVFMHGERIDPSRWAAYAATLTAARDADARALAHTPSSPDASRWHRQAARLRDAASMLAP